MNLKSKYFEFISNKIINKTFFNSILSVKYNTVKATSFSYVEGNDAKKNSLRRKCCEGI